MAEETPQQAIEEAKKASRAEVEGTDPDALDPELAVPRGAEVVSVLEALLFAATSPLTTKRISVLMNGVPEEEILAAFGILRERYSQPESGLILMEVAGGLQAATRPEVADWVLRLHRHRRRTALSPALMETLAIVAYKQPLTRAEVEAIRGVDCGTGIRSLQDAGLVDVVGRKETVGRPPLYGTSELFLKTFGLKEIDELPSVGELKSVMEAPMKGDKAAANPEDRPTDVTPAAVVDSGPGEAATEKSSKS